MQVVPKTVSVLTLKEKRGREKNRKFITLVTLVILSMFSKTLMSYIRK
jgi:hypothetical protein